MCVSLIHMQIIFLINYYTTDCSLINLVHLDTRGDKERNSITISTSTHNHTSTKPPHYITGPLPTGSRIVRTTSRTPTPTSYGGTEILVPLHTDPLANGNTTLTATSTGVAVVTINRSAGDLTTTGGSLL